MKVFDDNISFMYRRERCRVLQVFHVTGDLAA